MDSLLFHPKVVHLPLALAVLMPLIAGGVLLAWWRAWLPSRAWLIVVALQAVLLGSGFMAQHSGEAEEHRVEQVVAKQLVKAHEEAAERFVWASGAVLGLMLLAAALSSRAAGRRLAAAATAGTLVVFALGYRTGQAGGSLVYEHGAAQAYAAGSSTAAPAPEKHHEH